MRARNLLTSFGIFALLGATQALAIGEDQYLEPEDAFRYTATADEQNVTIEWRVTKGYYLYKKRMGLSAATPGVTVGDSAYPKGEIHKDDYFGEQEVFRDTFKVSAPLTGAKVGDTVALQLKWQGCADAGLCFPPSVWDASVKVVAAAAPVVEGEEEYLDVDKAFALTDEALSTNNLQLNWRIADGYYLYKQRIKVEPAGETKVIGALVLPKGEPHSDEYFGEQEIYRQSVDATFSVPPSNAKSVDVNVTYQGCADAGLCYPPQTKLVSISLEDAPPPTATDGSSPGTYVSEQDNLAELIKHGNLAWVLLVFFGIGLGLTFTPCVFPMIPILSGIIAGGGASITPRRSFMLSLSYVLGMAFTYTTAGILAAAIGGGLNLQAMFNQPWVIGLFSLLFVVLAASMFGLYTIEMPAFIQTRLSDTSNKQQGGTYVGVAVMGLLSALIVSACAAPALVATLAVIAQTGDVLRGGSALFVMSLGMGMPLMLVGTSAGTLLPRAGAWMDMVKNLFGVAFIGVAAWMAARVVPGWLAMIFWAITAALAAWFLWRGISKPTTGRTVARVLAGIAGAYCALLLVGTALGSTDPLRPIPQWTTKVVHLEFKRFKTVADLEREVAAASASGKTVMVDFYADWCASCLEMEHKTFSQPEVQAALKNTVLLQADVTANDESDRALYVHFGINGPPTIAFYGTDGKERRNFRVVGFMKPPEFAAVIQQAVATTPSTTP